jgi:myo-inositol 2-dehydrogenase/D-chiro-inositol 1-dehydrogenase
VIGRPFMVRSQTCDKNDPMVSSCASRRRRAAFFSTARARHRRRALAARQTASQARVRERHDRAARGLREFGDVDNGVAICEFEDGKLAVFYASRTMAHGNDTGSEVIGTAGALTIGRNPRLNRVEILDAHGIRNECTPTFFERFEDAFLSAKRRRSSRRCAAGRGANGRDLADALEATRIGIALRQSLQAGRR